MARPNSTAETRLIVARAVAKELNLPSEAEAKKTVDAVLESILSVVIDKGRVEFPHFGILRLRKLPVRIGFNPRTGESLVVQPSNILTFKNTKGLKDRLNTPASK